MKQLRLLPILGVILATLSACAAFAAAPADDGRIEVTLKDYDILPRVIRVKAGQQVTFVLKNEGHKLHELMIGRDVIIEDDFTEGFTEDFFAGIRPEIEGPGMVMGLEGGDMAGMEGMAGMDEHAPADGEMTGMDEHAMAEAGHDEDMSESTMMADEMEEQPMAEEEMTEGEMASNPDQMANDMPGMDEHAMAEEEMAGTGPDEDMSESTMMGDEMDEQAMTEGEMGGEMTGTEGMVGMDEHATAEGEMAGMKEHAQGESDEHTMAEGAMAGMEHDEMDMAGMGHDMVATSFGALQRPLMDAHAGLMVMLDPAPMPSETVTTITFTVPEDKVGEWEMGCFQEQGQHYDDGMRGTLIVEPAS